MATKSTDPMNALLDAITVSGKNIKDIPKKSIIEFLTTRGMDEKSAFRMYEFLLGNKPSNKNYNEAEITQMPTKEPRKKLFSDIIRIS